jgi:hypothetical protein
VVLLSDGVEEKTIQPASVENDIPAELALPTEPVHTHAQLIDLIHEQAKPLECGGYRSSDVSGVLSKNGLDKKKRASLLQSLPKRRGKNSKGAEMLYF